LSAASKYAMDELISPFLTKKTSPTTGKVLGKGCLPTLPPLYTLVDIRSHQK